MCMKDEIIIGGLYTTLHCPGLVFRYEGNGPFGNAIATVIVGGGTLMQGTLPTTSRT